MFNNAPFRSRTPPVKHAHTPFPPPPPLQGLNSVSLLEQRPWNPRLLSWSHITVDPKYAPNTPVELVAVSPEGQHVAVAGRRGLALYNRGYGADDVVLEVWAGRARALQRGSGTRD
jgi:hypothetical protein